MSTTHTVYVEARNVKPGDEIYTGAIVRKVIKNLYASPNYREFVFERREGQHDYAFFANTATVEVIR